MDEHTSKQIELPCSSHTSMEAAIQNAITKAGKTHHDIHCFQVVDTRSCVAKNKVDYWQVTIKLG